MDKKQLQEQSQTEEQNRRGGEGENETQNGPNHQRISSTGTLVLDDSLFGEKFLEPDMMQSMSSISTAVELPQPASVPPPAEQPTFDILTVNASAKRGDNEMKKQTKPRSNAASTKKKIAPNSKSASTTTSTSTTTAAKPSSGRKITGGVSKRVRRKCSVTDCTNRVVQGGLCISHGAKRKICGHPGCNKHVKKAGMCSTHGPARKRCEVEGCPKVAVQGGKCIAHGAKKKLCSVEGCKKQAILSGMCKKHHDQEKSRKETEVQNDTLVHYSSAQSHLPTRYCVPVNDSNIAVAKENEGNSPDLSGVGFHRQDSGTGPVSSSSSHRRGLSIFQDMSAVNTIIGSTSTSATPSVMNDVAASGVMRSSSGERGNRHNGQHNRGLSIFGEEEVVDKIVQNKIGI